MLIKSLQIGVIGLFLCIASACTTDQGGNPMVSVPAETGSIASASARPSSIQGIVKDARGQPIKGADIRIESRDGEQLFGTVKTDAKGYYISQRLQPGVYRVSLIVNGAVRAAIMNTKTEANQATQLNFDLKRATASQAAGLKRGKHMVWVPASTGSHIGGRWVEVDEGGAAAAGALNMQRGSAEALRQQQLNSAPGGLPGVSAGTGGN